MNVGKETIVTTSNFCWMRIGSKRTWRLLCVVCAVLCCYLVMGWLDMKGALLRIGKFHCTRSRLTLKQNLSSTEYLNNSRVPKELSSA
jgi:hypothetical protein